MKKLKYFRSSILILTFLSAAVIYGSISFVNHNLFRTSALDLGVYNNAIYKYGHFKMATSAVYEEEARNLFSDHFDLLVPILSPLQYVLGNYTLLIVQILALLLGAYGLYLYIKPKGDWAAVASVVYFLSFYGVFGAVSYDYHSNVIAAAILPWFFVFVRDKKLVPALLIFSLILVSKENMALWMVFVCAGMAIEFWKVSKLRNLLILGSVFSAFYFILVLSVIIPAIAPTKEYFHFDFSVLGANPKEALGYIISHPLETLKSLFENHMGDPNGDGIKAESYWALCFAGILLLIRKPQFLLMLIPILFQKMLNDDMYKWSVDVHYNVEFAPILAIGIFSVLSLVKRNAIRWSLLLVVCGFSIWSTSRILKSTHVYREDLKIQFQHKKHYRTHFDHNKVHEALKLIPEEASVSALYPFVPHLAFRDEIYQFPILHEAEYIVYSKQFYTFPLTKDHFDSYTDELKNSKEWEVVLDEEEITILRRVFKGVVRP